MEPVEDVLAVIRDHVDYELAEHEAGHQVAVLRGGRPIATVDRREKRITFTKAPGSDPPARDALLAHYPNLRELPDAYVMDVHDDASRDQAIALLRRRDSMDRLLGQLRDASP